MLLTSAFGPYARDDAYGSRLIKMSELLRNLFREFDLKSRLFFSPS